MTKPGLRFGSNRQVITLDESEISEAALAGLLMPSSFVDGRGVATFLQQSISAEQLSAMVFSVERDAEGTRRPLAGKIICSEAQQVAQPTPPNHKKAVMSVRQ